MEALKSLIEVYKDSKHVESLLSIFDKNQKARVKVEGAVTAYDSFLLAGLNATNKYSHIYIAADKEQAAFMLNTLESIVQDQAILFFPDSFKRPGNYEELNRNNVLIRTESINKISNQLQANEVMITYPEALFEKVVDPLIINKRKISIKVEENIDVDTMIELMVEYGFERTDFVYEPGHFSIRGGIIDIFSYGNEWPYRVELFDDEVESIRTFNPTTQLSIRTIKHISIIPDINGEYSAEDKVSVFQVFKPDTIIWMESADMLVDKIKECYEKAEHWSSQLQLETSDEMLFQILRERAFIKPEQIIGEIEPFRVIFMNQLPDGLKSDFTLKVNTLPQPSFNKNFTLLIENLNENEKAGINNFLFTDNARQVERFYNIFEDLKAEIKFQPVAVNIHSGFVDKDLNVACYTDHQIFERFHRYKLRKGFSKEQAVNLKMIREMQPGDYVVHIDHGVGKYSGLEKIDINGHTQESVRLVYQNNDLLYVSINSLHKISKYVGKDGTPPRVNKIGGDAWKTLKRKTKKKVKDIAKDLIKLYAKRKASKGIEYPADGYLQNELEASFIFEDTPDQYEATVKTKEDMMKPYPMDRLICGDVGFGKTEIAVRAAFKAVMGGKQVAILVPTTILALQHYKTFNDRIGQFGATVDYINRFRSTKEKKEIFQRLEEGKIDVIIGTHAILSKKIKFKDLGLLVIDEEQKFGVAAKEKLRNIKVNVDTLTLTATPIPRTLQFSLMAARDLSIIRTPPPNRQPIYTERRVFSENTIKESIYYEVDRGGQVFFVHNRVKSLPEMLVMVKKICPDVSVKMAHGQMDPKLLEKTLLEFINGEFDVLLSTNIIETGLDIANANTMIINNAHHFGMSDLHQLRGRVGRSNRKAYCYLFAPPISTLTSDARKRLKTLEDFSELGSGFHIAMRDLDIRGAGNLLGGEQSGFISDIGYQTYQKILEEAVQELKETDFKKLFQDEPEEDKKYVRDVEIDTDIEMMIPDDYISNIQERLNLYTELDSLENEEQIEKFREKLKDRFGKLPRQVEELFNGLRLRWHCSRMGFEKLSLKKKKLRCYFVRNPQSTFYQTDLFNRFMAFMTEEGESLELSLKQSNTSLILIKENVKNLKVARIILERIRESTAKPNEPVQ